jgi:hypothetical protein
MINLRHGWVCSICGQGLTRKSSAIRHNVNLHSGNASNVRPFEYLIGRINGKILPPLLGDPLSYRRNNNNKTRQNNDYYNNRPGSVYSHDNYDNNTYRPQPSYPAPTLSNSEVNQQSFHTPVHDDDKQSSYPFKPLAQMSKAEKLGEFERLVRKHYTPQDAQTIITAAYIQVYKFGREDFLEKNLADMRINSLNRTYCNNVTMNHQNKP